MENNIKITRFIDNDNAIAKQISVDGNKLHKESSASVKDGVVHSTTYSSMEDFRDFLTDMPTNECLLLGHFKHGLTARIVGSKEAQDVTKKLFSRSLENLEWHKDYQLLCIDYDGSNAGDKTPDEVIAIIDEVLPRFADITKVVKYSSSAWIYDKNGKLMSESNGFHIYFMVKHHSDLISKTFKGSSALLHKKLWLAGHGYIKNSKPKDRKTTAVTQMERTVYDNTVFSPERIIFEARPILKGDLYKENQEAFIIKGSADYLDLELYEDLSEKEEKGYLGLVKDAKDENENTPYMIESRILFKEHVREKIKSGKYKDRKEYKGLSTEEIVEREYKASREAVLMQDHMIEFASGDCITVEEIQKDPKKYHGQNCYDPHEPEYSNSPIAIIYTNQNVPIIFSHAHGGVTYRLTSTVQNDEPDFHSKEYWLEHFYMVAYDKKDEIYYIKGNKIEKYSHAGFNHKFSGYLVEVGGEENSKKISMTKWWMNNLQKKCIAGDGFAPDQPIIYEKYGELVINEYVTEILRHGFDIPSTEDCQKYAKPWLTHIRTMIHKQEESEILIDWFAYLVQHPNERPMFSPLILSETRGVGKDMMTDIWSEMMGHKYAKKSSIETLSKGDSWGDVFYNTKLITVSECGSSDDRYTVGNNIKASITANNMSMNIKGKAMVFGRVYSGIIFFSNSISPFRLDEGDRRFFVTRCDWTKEIADEYKENGHFIKLASSYSDPVCLHGLYHYLLNREIKTNMKGDAPMTSTKEIMMNSEPNEIEQFFVDLREHPCKYWTCAMINKLYEKEVGGDAGDGHYDNKQYKHFINGMVNVPNKMKVKGKTVRLKTFTLKDAEQDNTGIRENIEDNWDVSTTSLYPLNEAGKISLSNTNNVFDICCLGNCENDNNKINDIIEDIPDDIPNDAYFQQANSGFSDIVTRSRFEGISM